MILSNYNLYLGRLDNLKGIYEGSSCEFKCGCEKEYDVQIVTEESKFLRRIRYPCGTAKLHLIREDLEEPN